MTTSALVPEVDAETSDFKPLSAEEARRLREANPGLSPWWVVVAQVVAGGLVSAVVWAWTGQGSAAVSALYGALTVALPAALFAHGLGRGGAGGGAQGALLKFAVWELVKLASTVAMLALAPWLLDGLHWLALLAGVVAAMKMYWVALVVRPRLLNRN